MIGHSISLNMRAKHVIFASGANMQWIEDPGFYYMQFNHARNCSPYFAPIYGATYGSCLQLCFAICLLAHTLNGILYHDAS